METDDVVVISDSDSLKDTPVDTIHAKRRLRRGSSIYGSPVVRTHDSEMDKASLLYIAKLKNEKMEWKRFQEKIIAENSARVGQEIKCDFNDMNTELKDYCNQAPDMVKFAADTKDFLAKLAFYKKMENYHLKKMKYAEDRIKESVNEVTTKTFVDEIDEKIYLE